MKKLCLSQFLFLGMLVLGRRRPPIEMKRSYITYLIYYDISVNIYVSNTFDLGLLSLSQF